VTTVTLVALLERGLVDADAPHVPWLSTREAAPHGALHDAVHLVPRETDAAGDGQDRRFLQPVDHQRFEQRREPRARLTPRNADLPIAVLGSNR
jgi:hypothetical protein